MPENIEQNAPQNISKGISRGIKALILTLIILLVCAIGVAAYFHKQLTNVEADPTKAAQAENDALIAKIGSHLQLPKGESPTVATVTDPNALRSQNPQFFADAQVGYKLLIYTSAKEAILYDPAQDKIIAVAPISFGNQSASNTQTQPATQPSPQPAAATPQK